MRVLDPGHHYELAMLDCRDPDAVHSLLFVKRIGDRYPGNEPPAHQGTTMQEVLRALIDRARYVNGQIPCVETEAAIGLLETALLLFEVRAKRVKAKPLAIASLAHVVRGPICAVCGHVACEEHPQRSDPVVAERDERG